MEWLTHEDAAEVGRVARKRYDIDVPELGRRVGFLEATGSQLIALRLMTPDGDIPYQAMHSILPAVVVGEDGRPLFPGSELVGELPSSVIEALMREWLRVNNQGGAVAPDAPGVAESVADPVVDPPSPVQLTHADGLAKRDAIMAKMARAGVL